MSILIKDMKPPKSCYVCSWYNKVPCPVSDGKCYYRNKRHPSCPLVEIPTPHGRLIDADAIQDYNVETFGQRLLIIDTAPTVIEAEGET